MYRLIIIDDEPKILEGVCGLFPWEDIGFKVTATFTSAVKALEYIEKHGADVVLTDIEMPDMSGLELCSKLASYGTIQTVLFSSYTNYEYFRSAIHIRVEDYLIKPVKYAQLLECFERVKKRLDELHQKEETVPRNYYEQIIYKVTEYLNENYKNASLEDASACVNLSPNYLSKLFKEKSGMNFSETLQKIRMEKARELLQDSSFKIYDIAFYIGYDNPKNFSRVFKAYYDMSPFEYRKQVLDMEKTNET